MLRQLYIKNYTLIDELTIDFNGGFSVITGETGAGKSVIVGAVGLLSGARADFSCVKAGQNRCVVEAHFDVSAYGIEQFFADNDLDYVADDCILRREINSTGRSRAFINDMPVALGLLRELGEMLLDIHSQHQNLLLNKDDFQLGVVDVIARSKSLLSEYKGAFAEYSNAQKALEKMKSDIAASRSNEDFLRYQYEEISKLALHDGEQATLEHDVEAMRHSEDIKSALYESGDVLDNEENGALEKIRHAKNALSGIVEFLPEMNDAATRLENCYIEIKDVAEELSARIDDVDFEPQRLNRLSERLDSIYTLEKKHNLSTDTELIELEHSLEKQLENIDNGDEMLAELAMKVDELHSKCMDIAGRLHSSREKASAAIEKEMLAKLSPLGIPDVRFKVEISEKPLSSDGFDKVAFLFSANKNMPLQPVSQVASGGEISRVMLSLKAMISAIVNMPTIIFDEIDTGVSGRVAEKMAQIMFEMGKDNRQVIAITHLPQIAAMGETHYRVSKTDTGDSTISSMKMLSQDERIMEIAAMLSGTEVTEAAIANAKELLAKKHVENR